jgi:hypothetical protein
MHMSRITKAARRFPGVAAAVALAALGAGCAKQESVITAQADTPTQAAARNDIPEVIVTASRDHATSGGTMRHE